MVTPRTIFRIIYATSYTTLYTILLLLLLISPADTVYQSLRSHQRNNIWIVTIVLFLTVSILAFIYVTRLYINRTALQQIPKAWIPVGKGEVPRGVEALVSGCLSRSAAIAYVSRPHGPSDITDAHEPLPPSLPAIPPADPLDPSAPSTLIPPSATAIWTHLSHPGWSPPTLATLPSIHYDLITSELPGLLEARVFLVACPSDPSTGQPLPAALDVLQRTPNMSIRDYLSHLLSLAVIAPSPDIPAFLTPYESSRYSRRPLGEASFKMMLDSFSRILQMIKPLDVSRIPSDDHKDNDDNVFSGQSSLESGNSSDSVHTIERTRLRPRTQTKTRTPTPGYPHFPGPEVNDENPETGSERAENEHGHVSHHPRSSHNDDYNNNDNDNNDNYNNEQEREWLQRVESTGASSFLSSLGSVVVRRD